jgi:hypothetical protein
LRCAVVSHGLVKQVAYALVGTVIVCPDMI